MKNYKKLFLALGTVGVASASIALAISCSPVDVQTTYDYTVKDDKTTAASFNTNLEASLNSDQVNQFDEAIKKLDEQFASLDSLPGVDASTQSVYLESLKPILEGLKNLKPTIAKLVKASLLTQFLVSNVNNFEDFILSSNKLEGIDETSAKKLIALSESFKNIQKGSEEESALIDFASSSQFASLSSQIATMKAEGVLISEMTLDNEKSDDTKQTYNAVLLKISTDASKLSSAVNDFDFSKLFTLTTTNITLTIDGFASA